MVELFVYINAATEALICFILIFTSCKSSDKIEKYCAYQPYACLTTVMLWCILSQLPIYNLKRVIIFNVSKKKKVLSLLTFHTRYTYRILNKLVSKKQANLLTLSNFYKKGITLAVFDIANPKINQHSNI